MKISVLNQSGEKVKDISVSEILDKTVSKEALTLYVNYLRNALRGPVANSKDRSEVSGGGKKPWKQKGTGRARAGSSRSPIWVGGGVTFGPSKNNAFRIKINKSMKKAVIASVLGGMFKDKKAIVVENLSIKEPKTKDAISILENIKAEGKLSVVLSASDDNAEMSFRNISSVNMMSANRLGLIEIMSSDNLVMSEPALREIEEAFSVKKKVKEVE